MFNAILLQLVCCLFPMISVIAWSAPSNIYHISESTIGKDFYTHFNWEAIADPTHGRVNYVDEPTSIEQNLTYASFDTFILRADYKATLDPSGPGRNSVRIISKSNYTTHVAVFDIRHMPQGCGTWPAIWATQGANWPDGGEIDIVEGVNDQGPNQATLHTTEGCTMPQSRLETGAAQQLDCNWLTNGNAGCGVRLAGDLSYGPEFNSNFGGWYAMERTNDFISVWFWPRDATDVPREVRDGTILLTTQDWGVPAAYFPNTDCDIAKYFGEHNIIINLTLCGDWAGNVYSQSTCPSTCIDFVNNNPAAFEEAYFDFASIRVYEP